MCHRSYHYNGPRINYLPSLGCWVRYPVWKHTFVSPSAFSRRAVVSYWRKYVQEVLVNRLGGLSLPRKSVVRLTDRPDMTLDVYRGRKTTIQHIKFLGCCWSIKEPIQTVSVTMVASVCVWGGGGERGGANVTGKEKIVARPGLEPMAPCLPCEHSAN